MRKIRVWLEGREEFFFLGATVRDLAGRLPTTRIEAFRTGSLQFADGEGHLLGDDGVLEDGEHYRLMDVRNQ